MTKFWLGSTSLSGSRKLLTDVLSLLSEAILEVLGLGRDLLSPSGFFMIIQKNGSIKLTIIPLFVAFFYF